MLMPRRGQRPRSPHKPRGSERPRDPSIQKSFRGPGPGYTSRRSPLGGRIEKGISLTGIVATLHAILSLGLIFLILLHAGKGGGLSDMFGGGYGGGGAGESTVVERNLDRLTVIASTLFGLTTVWLTLLWR